MNKTILLIISLIGLFIACETDEPTPEPITNALVLGIGYDCGDSFLIQFDEDVPDVPENSWDNIFYEINLPEEYKVADERIYCEFRLPIDEGMFCSHWGPGYPQIYITSASSE